MYKHRNLVERFFQRIKNHGYAVEDVEEKSLVGLPIEVTHISLNDGTIEGVRHKFLPVTSVQYHPEAAPGSNDSIKLFNEFIEYMNRIKSASLCGFFALIRRISGK